MLMACTSSDDSVANDVTVTPSPRLTLVQSFAADDAGNWHKADGWSNGAPFLNGWCQDQVSFVNGLMSVTLESKSCATEVYASGEYRSNDFYGYGYYEARFRAVSGAGLVTSLFTYTGASDGNPHDEIDMEILGQDTTRLQVNYWSNGVEHPVMINLGFDAADAMHVYAFEWTQNTINWYVDNILVHTEDGSNGNLPSTPGRIMVNAWACSATAWCGGFNPASLPVVVQYDWLGYGP